jgi:Mg-chelatase subunit ChlD
MTKAKSKIKDTIVNFVLDETGSMQSVKQATISGVNEYLESLRNQKGRVYLTLTQFNSEKIEVVHKSASVKKVPDLTDETYQPNWNTPLYDAIAETIQATEKRIKRRKNKPNVLCVIMTDGLENASKEWTRDAIFKLITEKTADGWTFAYLGANQDAFAVGQSIGIAKGSSMHYPSDARGVSIAMTSVSESTSDWMDSGGAQSSSFFTPDEDDEEEDSLTVIAT